MVNKLHGTTNYLKEFEFDSDPLLPVCEIKFLIKAPA